MRTFLIPAAALMLITSLGTASALGSDYDPLRVIVESSIRTTELTVNDSRRGRDIPLKVYLPSSGEAAPVVLFSHGLGGNREGSEYLGRHWAARGYVAVFLQHPGSDDSVWKELPVRERMAAMRRAADARSALLRFQDVPAVIDQLQELHDSADHEWQMK